MTSTVTQMRSRRGDASQRNEVNRNEVAMSAAGTTASTTGPHVCQPVKSPSNA